MQTAADTPGQALDEAARVTAIAELEHELKIERDPDERANLRRTLKELPENKPLLRRWPPIPIHGDARAGYQMERLRCDACGAVFTAPVTAAAGLEKYAPSVGVAVAVFRYGTGIPHYRLERFQQSLGVPLPASTQWELMAPLADQAQPIFAELVAQAANAPLLHHDDTTMRILDLRRPGSATAEELAQLVPHRKGTFTTNILAEVAQHPVALYFTGWQHAGENLAAVLRQRAKNLAPPIQMCDALSRNLVSEFDTILARCTAHARREFVTVAPSFGDLFMSLIQSCRLNQVNPFAYLLAIATHAKEVQADPSAWLPWNYPHSEIPTELGHDPPGCPT